MRTSVTGAGSGRTGTLPSPRPSVPLSALLASPVPTRAARTARSRRFAARARRPPAATAASTPLAAPRPVCIRRIPAGPCLAPISTAAGRRTRRPVPLPSGRTVRMATTATPRLAAGTLGLAPRRLRRGGCCSRRRPGHVFGGGGRRSRCFLRTLRGTLTMLRHFRSRRGSICCGDYRGVCVARGLLGKAPAGLVLRRSGGLSFGPARLRSLGLRRVCSPRFGLGTRRMRRGNLEAATTAAAATPGVRHHKTRLQCQSCVFSHKSLREPCGQPSVKIRLLKRPNIQF